MTPRFLPAPMVAAALALTCAGCKPPPTDAAVARVSLVGADGPSAPIASPDTTGAVWAKAAGNEQRIVYGVPGQPVLLAIECLAPGTPEAALRITRHAPADEGAAALLALIGNGKIGRFPVAATPAGARLLWQGKVSALLPAWDALKPEREATVTVPGAGLVKLAPSPVPMALISACRGDQMLPEPAALPLPPADQA